MFNLAVTDGIGRLALRRPEFRNAIPLSGWAELAGRVEAAAAEGVRLLVVEGMPGGAFCAGADLSDFDSFSARREARAEFRKAMRSGLDTLADLPVPTLAVIEGDCYGAGVALAMACDLRMAGPRARFAVTPAKLGLSYPQEDVHALVSLVGRGQAARLLFGARAIDGVEAARIGLVDEVVHGDIDAAVRDFATAVTANDAESLRVLKRGLRLASGGVDRDEAQDRAFDLLLGSEALARRLAAHRSRKA